MSGLAIARYCTDVDQRLLGRAFCRGAVPPWIMPGFCAPRHGRWSHSRHLYQAAPGPEPAPYPVAVRGRVRLPRREVSALRCASKFEDPSSYQTWCRSLALYKAAGSRRRRSSP
jgi:hypothetical protein